MVVLNNAHQIKPCAQNEASKRVDHKLMQKKKKKWTKGNFPTETNEKEKKNPLCSWKVRWH